MHLLTPRSLFCLALFACALIRSALAQEPPLKYITTIASSELDGVVAMDISKDGRHAYAAAFIGKTVCIFSRDAQTGGLERIDAINNPALFNGLTAVRLSPDNRFAVGAAFRSKAAVLLTRDAKTGKLTLADSHTHGGNNTKALLDFAIDAAWSPDSKFVYVIAPQSAAVTVFRITAKPAFEFVEAQQGEGNCFAGARGIAVSPDGKFVYIASEGADTLSVLKRDANTGKLEVLEILKAGDNTADGLDGAFSVDVSPDGKFVYLSSGRFTGRDAITVFQKQNDGKLKLVDEMFNFTEKLERFVGGNEITISPDGKRVYAAASRSDSLVVLDRDVKTGKLKQTQFLVDQFQGVGAMLMPGGVTVSPDGQFIYVSAEGSDGIAIFQKPGPPKPAIAEKAKP